jgi:hypothetical protein
MSLTFLWLASALLTKRLVWKGLSDTINTLAYFGPVSYKVKKSLITSAPDDNVTKLIGNS